MVYAVAPIALYAPAHAQSQLAGVAQWGAPHVSRRTHYQTSTLAEYLESIWFFVTMSSSSLSDASSSNKKTWLTTFFSSARKETRICTPFSRRLGTRCLASLVKELRRTVCDTHQTATDLWCCVFVCACGGSHDVVVALLMPPGQNPKGRRA